MGGFGFPPGPPGMPPMGFPQAPPGMMPPSGRGMQPVGFSQ